MAKEVFWKPLLETERKRLKEVFPDEYDVLVRMPVEQLYDELCDRTVYWFENDEPTPRSDEIERLADSIFWDRNHNPQLWSSK